MAAIAKRSPITAHPRLSFAVITFRRNDVSFTVAISSPGWRSVSLCAMRTLVESRCVKKAPPRAAFASSLTPIKSRFPCYHCLPMPSKSLSSGCSRKRLEGQSKPKQTNRLGCRGDSSTLRRNDGLRATAFCAHCGAPQFSGYVSLLSGPEGIGSSFLLA